MAIFDRIDLPHPFGVNLGDGLNDEALDILFVLTLGGSWWRRMQSVHCLEWRRWTIALIDGIGIGQQINDNALR